MVHLSSSVVWRRARWESLPDEKERDWEGSSHPFQIRAGEQSQATLFQMDFK